MSVAQSTEVTAKRLGLGWYILAITSFIPLLGLPFGLISIIIGFVRRSSGGFRLVAIGSAGIAFTIVLYVSAFVVARRGNFDRLRALHAQRLLDDSVRSIESYKLQNGEYPESLEAVKAENPFIYDPFLETSLRFPFPRPLFSYQRLAGGNSYSLFSVDPDRIPSTKDGLYPSPATTRGTGYLPP